MKTVLQRIAIDLRNVSVEFDKNTEIGKEISTSLLNVADSLENEYMVDEKKQIINIFADFVNEHFSHSSENYRNELKLAFEKFLKTKLG